MRIFTVSIPQPWASLLVLGGKRFDTHARSIAYRGPLLIYAARGIPRGGDELCLTNEHVRRTLSVIPGFRRRRMAALPYGVICGMADVIASHRLTPETHRALGLRYPELSVTNFAIGKYAWEFIDPLVAEPPVPVAMPTARASIDLSDDHPLVAEALRRAADYPLLRLRELHEDTTP